MNGDFTLGHLAVSFTCMDSSTQDTCRLVLQSGSFLEASLSLFENVSNEVNICPAKSLRINTSVYAGRVSSNDIKGRKKTQISSNLKLDGRTADEFQLLSTI